MGRYIMKANADEDYYVVWSTVVGSAVFDGTWAEVCEYEEERALDRLRGEMRNEFAHLQETGTTVRTRYRGGEPFTGSWEDEELYVVNCPFDNPPDDWKPGHVKREDLKRWLETEDNTLITPVVWDA